MGIVHVVGSNVKSFNEGYRVWICEAQFGRLFGTADGVRSHNTRPCSNAAGRFALSKTADAYEFLESGKALRKSKSVGQFLQSMGPDTIRTISPHEFANKRKLLARYDNATSHIMISLTIIKSSKSSDKIIGKSID